MAISPLFTSAPRCRLRLGTQLLASAVGFNINISVDVQPVMIVGELAPVSLETTMYNTVTGTFQILRLRDPMTSGNTNGIAGAQAKLAGHLDTAKILLTKTFDIHVYVAVPTTSITGNSTISTGQSGVLANPLSGSTFDSALDSSLTEVLWLKIQNCRITSRNTNIAMGQIINEPLNFQGLIAINDVEDVKQQGATPSAKDIQSDDSNKSS